MSHVPYLMLQKCCCCKKSLRNKNVNQNISRVGAAMIEKIKAFCSNNSINIGDYICNACRKKVSKIHDLTIANESQSFNTTEVTAQELNIESINNLQLIRPNRIQRNRSDSQQSNVLQSNSRVKRLIIDKDESDESESIHNTIKNESSKLIMIRTAYSTHKHCLLCSNTKGLHKVKPESIIYAYKNHRILIKHHARCCSRHLDENGIIVVNEFQNIKTFNKEYNKDTILILDVFIMNSDKIQTELITSSGVFDKFKNMAALEEDLCIKITGWTKQQFQSFSNYITCVRDTAGRTKEQLIAIYRYWLSKGLDQSTLALLKYNTSQQQISHYLAQIRYAIHKEFVPLFLGANKGKQFYLKHNTDSVKILHDMNEHTLAVIVDGTYTTLEKSSNNNFQYISYSIQKSTNLVKPFIACCADGYFIDCYGAFQANANDATILRYILRNDPDLVTLLTPHDEIVLFLDRGFRDIYWELVDDGFNVQIPTCIQLEKDKKIRKKIAQINQEKNNNQDKNNQENIQETNEEKNKETNEENNKENNEVNKQNIEKKSKNENNLPLTTAQAGETRLVTKVRFIIEKQNGMLKNKKALDNIRNTEAGHILIDYRNCCAMINFAFNPCIPDGSLSVKIAQIIILRSQKKQNKLKSLLGLRLFNTLEKTDINMVNDFPKLEPWQINEHISLGIFKLNMCPSYLNQLINNSSVFLLSDKQISTYVTNEKVRQELATSKILAVKITSRHKRGNKPIAKKKRTNQEITEKAKDQTTKKNIQHQSQAGSNEKHIPDQSKKSLQEKPDVQNETKETEKQRDKQNRNPLDPDNFANNYRVFIQYTPVETSSQSSHLNEDEQLHNPIKRFICSCPSGRQVVGCCVHVVTILYYLGHAKELLAIDRRFIKLPGEHLNSVYVKMETFESPNKPRYVRHKRRRKKYIIDNKRPNLPICLDNSELSTDDESESESEDLKLSNNKRKSDVEQSESLASKNKKFKTLNIQNNHSNIVMTEITPKNDVSSRNKKVKNPLDTDKKDNFHISTTSETQFDKPSVNEIIPTFTNHIPSLGGYFIKPNGKKVKVTNTCTIDNYLFSFWVLSKLSTHFDSLDNTSQLFNKIIKIISSIEKYDWDTARQVWYAQVMQKNMRNNKEISFFGGVDQMFLQYMYEYQKHDLIQKCSPNCIYSGNTIISEKSDILHFGKIQKIGIQIVTDTAYKLLELQQTSNL